MDEDFNNEFEYYYNIYMYYDDWYIAYDYRNDDFVLYRIIKFESTENELDEEYSIETYRSKIYSLCIQFGMENFMN